MKNSEKTEVLKMVAAAHSAVENLYLEDPAVKGSAEWLQKRRLLLADVGLHLVQAALMEDEVNTDKLKRYLFSILTISEEFVPGYSLTQTANQLMPVNTTLK